MAQFVKNNNPEIFLSASSLNMDFFLNQIKPRKCAAYIFYQFYQDPSQQFWTELPDTYLFL